MEQKKESKETIKVSPSKDDFGWKRSDIQRKKKRSGKRRKVSQPPPDSRQPFVGGLKFRSSEVSLPRLSEMTLGHEQKSQRRHRNRDLKHEQETFFLKDENENEVKVNYLKKSPTKVDMQFLQQDFEELTLTSHDPNAEIMEDFYHHQQVAYPKNINHSPETVDLKAAKSGCGVRGGRKSRRNVKDQTTQTEEKSFSILLKSAKEATSKRSTKIHDNPDTEPGSEYDLVYEEVFFTA